MDDTFCQSLCAPVLSKEAMCCIVAQVFAKLFDKHVLEVEYSYGSQAFRDIR